MQRIVSIPAAAAYSMTVAASKAVIVQSGDLSTLVESAMVFQLGNRYESFLLYNADHSVINFGACHHLIHCSLQTGMDRFFVVPRGMEGIVEYIKERYHNMPMFVTENGNLPFETIYMN